MANLLNKKIALEDIYQAADKIIFNRFFQRKLFLLIMVSVLLVVFFIQTVPSANQWDRDSPSFYTAAKGITKKIDIYDWEGFQTLADSIFGKSEIVYPYLYSPVLAQLFILLLFWITQIISFSYLFSMCF